MILSSFVKMDNPKGGCGPVPVSDDEDNSVDDDERRSDVDENINVEQTTNDHTNVLISSNKQDNNTNSIQNDDAVSSHDGSGVDNGNEIDNVSLDNCENETNNYPESENFSNVPANMCDDVSDNDEEEPFSSNQDNENVIRSYPHTEQQEPGNDIENVSDSASLCTSPREVVDDFSIAQEMNKYIKVNRINWAELEEVNDLWAICDAISAAHSGLPDSLLKDSFLLVLEGHISKNTNNWMRQHLQTLLRLWKKELQTEKPTERPTRFISASVEYAAPVIVIMKRKNNSAKKKTQLQRLMGVGEMLEQARVKFATENGEYDVEEDEHGNFSIGGQELTFESWGEINKIKDDDIVHSSIVPPKQKRNRARANASMKPRMQATIPLAAVPVVQIPTSMTMPQTALPSSYIAPLTNDNVVKNENGKESMKSLPKPEKDEGELSESDDDHSDSTSSSGSDDDLQAASRQRRKKRRENERQKGQTSVSNMSSMFQKFYQYRFQIAQSLTLQQKASFMDLIKQSNGGMSEARQQQITQFMVNFMGEGK